MLPRQRVISGSSQPNPRLPLLLSWSRSPLACPVLRSKACSGRSRCSGVSLQRKIRSPIARMPNSITSLADPCNSNPAQLPPRLTAAA
nr:hypothetical protein [Tanacetum cinerariifolium]